MHDALEAVEVFREEVLPREEERADARHRGRHQVPEEEAQARDEQDAAEELDRRTDHCPQDAEHDRLVPRPEVVRDPPTLVVVEDVLACQTREQGLGEWTALDDGSGGEAGAPREQAGQWSV